MLAEICGKALDALDCARAVVMGHSKMYTVRLYPGLFEPFMVNSVTTDVG